MSVPGEPGNQSAHALAVPHGPIGSVVPHGGWRAGFDASLAALMQGPACVILLGAPGTGKTLLLRELADSLRRRGRIVRFLMCGDLPVGTVGENGEVLLIDEAARMAPAVLAGLAAQPPCPLVLAGLPDFADTLKADRPIRVELLPLAHAEARRFVIDWLIEAGAGSRLTIPAIERVLAHAAGVPRVLVQVLKAALSMAADQANPITARDVDQVAALRGQD